jgi:hypothetical protein
VVWRLRSDSTLVPKLGLGLLFVGLILMLFLPAISITDDLAQSPALPEGAKLQDSLKAPEHFVQLFALPVLLSFLAFYPSLLGREISGYQCLLKGLICWNANIQKRPPPQILSH